MKKSWLKRAAAFCLALGLVVGLCACGGRDDKPANAGLAKECVYKLSSVSMPDLGGDSYNVLGSAHKDGMIYLMVEVYHWEEASQNTDIKLISMQEDGSGAQVKDLEIPQSQETAVDEETQKKLDEGNAWQYENYYNYTFSPDGRVYGMRQYQFEDYSDPENYISKQDYYVECWNGDGSFQWEKPLEGLASEEEYVYVSAMAAGADGNLYMMLTGDEICTMTVDAQGNASEKKPLPETASAVFENYNNLLVKEDGTFLVMYSDENDWTKQFMVTFDPASGAVGEPCALPPSLAWGGYNSMNAGTTSDMLYSNEQGLYSYNAGDEDSKMKMSFINSDLNITNLSNVVELSGQSFFAVFYEDYENEMKAGIFTYVDPKDIPDKAVLVLAGSYVGGDMKKRIVEFNRASDQYRIVVRDYSSYNTYEDYQAGYTQLNNDIISGNIPDILITEGLPIDNYASKGLLADVGKLIEEDEELSQVEFVQNVLDAYSVDGKLYYVIPNFGVRTMVAKESLVGDRTSWTMQDAQKLMETMPEGTALMGEMTRDGFFNTMMGFCGRDFVDITTGKCDFDSQNFMDMMEFAKSLPAELGDDYYGDDYWMNYQTQYRDNRTILCSMVISNFSSLNYTINGRIGEEISYIGFPTESGQGSYINANESYAIAARSKNLEGAWEFVRYYLTDAYQETLDWGMPIQMKYFKQNSLKALEKPYYLDENGNKVEHDDTFYLNDEEIVLPLLTEEQLDKAVNFVLSINKCSYYNEELMKIINEEMEAFYSGQKPAADVAKIIQSRAQMYVETNR